MKEAELSRRQRRGERLIRELVHDPNKTRLKLAKPTVCPQCGAVFHKGRWTWDDRRPEANEKLCQACHRVNDKYPAGIPTLTLRDGSICFKPFAQTKPCLRQAN